MINGMTNTVLFASVSLANVRILQEDQNLPVQLRHYHGQRIQNEKVERYSQVSSQTYKVTFEPGALLCATL